MTTIERATPPLLAVERTTLEGWLDLAVATVDAERVLGIEQPGGDLLDAGLRHHVGHLGDVVYSPERTHQTWALAAGLR